jgi:hypothetical protein
MANAVAAATRANTSIFSIDPRGLAPLTNGAAHFDDAPIEGHTSLQVLAEDTGGRAILRTNNLRHALRSDGEGRQLVLRPRLRGAARSAPWVVPHDQRASEPSECGDPIPRGVAGFPATRRLPRLSRPRRRCESRVCPRRCKRP